MADVQFNLRIPEELKDMVKSAAKESGRSINAEAQHRLEQSFINNSDVSTLQDFANLFKEMNQQNQLIQKQLTDIVKEQGELIEELKNKVKETNLS